jgi:hypothetical protein
MSRPKNSTTHEATQQPTLVHVEFGDALMEYTSPQMSVMAGGDLLQGLKTASELTEGLTQLCGRLHFAVNYGELVFTAELRALAFLSDAVHALIRSAERSMNPPDQDAPEARQ